MLRSASLAAAKGLGPDEAYVRNMLGFIWQPLAEAIPKVGAGGCWEGACGVGAWRALGKRLGGAG